jgi:GTP cyclohydrolase II
VTTNSHAVPDGLIRHALTLENLGDVEVFVRDATAAPLAVCYGDWREGRDPILVRVQSSCVYGEVFHSLDCDCRAQLDLALQLVRKEGAGIVVYLDQEGRGAGRVNKAKGYAYSQTKDVDSFVAYESMGIPIDDRDYSPASELLKRLGLTHIRLLTNNPRKVEGITDDALRVDREELWSDLPTENARKYVSSKLRRGHFAPAGTDFS